MINIFIPNTLFFSIYNFNNININLTLKLYFNFNFIQIYLDVPIIFS